MPKLRVEKIGIPSGPGALSADMDVIADNTSSSEKGTVRVRFSSSVTFSEGVQFEAFNLPHVLPPLPKIF